MEVKTENGGTFDAAGKGTTGLSIAGLVTGATALVGGGLLNMINANGCGGWNNRNNGGYYNNCGNGFRRFHDDLVTQDELYAYERYDNLFSALEKERAERYTDKSIIEYNKDKFAFNKDIADAIVEDRQRLAALEQYNKSMREIMALKEENYNIKLECLKDKMFAGDALEAERRSTGDQNLFNWANSRFVPGKLVMPMTSICPEVMPAKNAWVAPTNTPTTNETVA